MDRIERALAKYPGTRKRDWSKRGDGVAHSCCVVHPGAVIGSSAILRKGTFGPGAMLFDGIFEGGNLMSGIFKGGEFWGGRFTGGLYLGGNFLGGDFLGGTYYGGRFQNAPSGTTVYSTGKYYMGDFGTQTGSYHGNILYVDMGSMQAAVIKHPRGNVDAIIGCIQYDISHWIQNYESILEKERLVFREVNKDKMRTLLMAVATTMGVDEL